MTIVNSWLIYKRDATSLMVLPKGVYKQCIHKLRLSAALMEAEKLSAYNLGRPSNCRTSERRHLFFLLCQLKINVMISLAKNVSTRQMLLFEDCKGRTIVECPNCNLHL